MLGVHSIVEDYVLLHDMHIELFRFPLGAPDFCTCTFKKYVARKTITMTGDIGARITANNYAPG